MEFRFQSIGVIHSCFKEKFGIPRQPGLVPEAKATLELLPPYDRPEAVAELAGFSHVWIVFVFHQALRTQWRPTVRPPRLGGNKRIGVFASRAPYRPNPIGLSLVALEGLDTAGGKCLLQLGGVDLLDGTPVLDIKPYLPYAEAIPEARAGYALEPPAATVAVSFSALAQAQVAAAEVRHPGLAQLIRRLVAADPRPAYHAAQAARQQYGMRLWDYDVRWTVTNDAVCVTAVETVEA
jgi:tRNA-Thr(GGU) m(6)t(6)A37 methyltransferase TsaA